MTEFFRGPQWASATAQQEWEPRIGAARQAWQELEPLSVQAGLRPSALFSMTPEDLVRASKAVALNTNLEITVLGTAMVPGEYTARTATAGTPGLRVAMHRAGLRRTWVEAWAASDDDAIGQLLGFPPCCVEFFKKVWVEDRRMDTTIAMAGGADGPSGANILLRWLGVRLVPHLPCSFVCPGTTAQAAGFAALGRASGMTAEIDAAEALLSLPMRYSALHGIGFVEVPGVFRFAFSTDYTTEMVVVDRRPVMILAERGPLAAQEVEPEPERPARRSIAAMDSIHGDNGFVSGAAMDTAHSVIEKLAIGSNPPEERTVIDLGCGDGTLLDKLRRRGIETVLGVEHDQDRVERGRRRYPDVVFQHGRIQDLDPPDMRFDLGILMPGRLLEMTEEEAARTREWISQNVSRLLVYTYDGKDLEELAQSAGFELRTNPLTLLSTSAAFAQVRITQEVPL